MSVPITYSLDNVPPRLEPIADVVRKHGKEFGFHEFEVERNSGLSSVSFYVDGNNKTVLHVGMKYLSYLQDNRNVWARLADNIVKEVVSHEKNGHLCNSYSCGMEGIYRAMERAWFNPHTEEANMIRERQANLNELCLDREVGKEDMTSKIAIKLWSRAIYTPVSYMEELIRHDKLKSLCGSCSFIAVLAKQDGVEEKVAALSYKVGKTDMEKAKTIVSGWVRLYLDDAYPWLKDGFKKNVVDEVLKIDEEYRNKKIGFDNHATEQ